MKKEQETLVPKKLTLEDLKKVTGGISPNAISAKGEDADGNKVEVG
ncbi:MAG TPA: hypothetical protein VFK02_06020 [Kofleriaceae bacterium]|nr:hypothetical protein [Kofleriaceae bacterium]